MTENLIKKMEFSYRYNYTISLFKPLLDLNIDEILKDILKEDYQSIIKVNVKLIFKKGNFLE